MGWGWGGGGWCCFFFQAEDGIRDWSVTGVQTCALPILEPHHLAAACAALLIEEPRPDTWNDAHPTERSLDVVGELRDIRRSVLKTQRRHQVMIPAWLEPQLIGIVAHWALGADWGDLCGRTSLDDGDVVRILRRTLDLLSQLRHMPHIPETIKDNASRARMLMDRFPVAENVA